MRRRKRPLRLAIHDPLGRYGFTALAVLALLNGLLYPAVVVGLVAAYAWKARP